jgi:cytochrome c oxidase assembly protein subunit 15
MFSRLLTAPRRFAARHLTASRPMIRVDGRLACAKRALRGTALLSTDSVAASSSASHATLYGDRAVSNWLFTCAGVVFGIVVVGGLTRLTKSGLSMVEWKVQGTALPSGDDEWNVEFDKYKASPEYEKHNEGMPMSEFKFIYFMEWGHRMLGRTAGVVFAVPALYYAARGRLSKPLCYRLSGLFVLGGMQGMIGWWMVKSGLEAPPSDAYRAGEVRVSPYRLATHLISAFTIYGILLTTGLRVRAGGFPLSDVGKAAWTAAQRGGAAQSVAGIGLTRFAAATSGLILVTTFSGAFVAGNEAGLVYNEFPYMGEGLVPSDLISPYLQPAWRNMFENSSCVQFDHRVLAMTTAATVAALFAVVKTKGGALSPRVHRAAHLCVGMVAVQVGLGITTLLMLVPVPLASAHQAGSLTLLTFGLYLHHTLASPGAVVAAVAAGGAEAAAVTAAVAAAPAMTVASVGLLGLVAALSVARSCEDDDELTIEFGDDDADDACAMK